MASIYDFALVDVRGKEVSLAEYRGKTLLIVNVASACGFTPQYTGLQALYQKHKDRGLVVLGVPCNQFGNQEPGTAEEIEQFCTGRFGVTFPIFSKVEVNGAGAHPLFTFLKEAKPGLLGTTAIKWNFTKFLVDKEGAVIERFAPNTAPEALEKVVVEKL